MPICLAISRRLLLLSHMIRLYASLMFLSPVAPLGHPDRSWSSKRSLSKFSSPFLHHAVRRRLIPKGYYVVHRNFLAGHALLTEVLYDGSNFNFVHFRSVTHLSPVCSEFLLSEISGFEILLFLPKMLNKIIKWLRFRFNLFLQSISGRELDHTS